MYAISDINSASCVCRISLSGLVLFALMMMNVPVSGDIEVYEPFDYPPGGLNGQGGSAEFGFTGNWSANSFSSVASNTLSYSSLPVLGRSVGGLNGGVNRYGGARTLDPRSLLQQGLLDDGKTLWFSIVLGYGSGANVVNAGLSFALSNNQFGSGNTDLFISDDGELLGDGIGLQLSRYTNGIPGQVFAVQYRDAASSGNVFGSSEGAQPFYGEGENGLIVGEIKWAASNDTIRLYRPDTNFNLGLPISLLIVSVAQTNYDTLTWRRGDVVVFDEIRFGSSYDNVLGIPDPPKGTVITLY